ncbi:prolyl oligopeptidase family serine peptidase [Chitinophaga sancti]|uniref:alpha/beta hydrolase family protein n=1 Tax=Chitinophaga sancti TaxID=1004 RepID=UPI002A74FA61|nr:prolyl oligopeptidase family serine peptidase [Chitinophaga sancti]WPQ63374.1 prolyl oligopeptidase family serine peptidase [Chitinophaga sancti]
MKSLLLTVIISLIYCGATAQKNVIDSTIIDNWMSVSNGTISNDGNYVTYTQRKGRTGHAELVIKNLSNKKELVIAGGDMVKFTDNSHILVVRLKDSIGLVSLKDFSIHYVDNLKESRVFSKDNHEYLIYKKNNDSLFVKSIEDVTIIKLGKVRNYWTSENGERIVLLKPTQDSTVYSLSIFDLNKGTEQLIWNGEGSDVSNLVISPGNKHYAFLLPNNLHQVFYYADGMSKAIPIIDDQTPGIDARFNISGIKGFSGDSEHLFFTIIDKELPKPLANSVLVDVYSYKDEQLQSLQLMEKRRRDYVLVYNFIDKEIIRLQYENEHIDLNPGEGNERPGIINNRIGDPFEQSWNPLALNNIFLIDVFNGKRIKLQLYDNIGFSPDRTYMVGMDSLSKDYFTYNLLTHQLNNITASLPIPLEDSALKFTQDTRQISIPGWLPNNTGVLVNDRYDIWLADPNGMRQPVCITDGFGRSNNITFRIIGRCWMGNRVIDPSEPIILNAFNHFTKDNGFYSVKIGKPGSLRKLTIGPYIYDVEDVVLGGMSPLKAKYSKRYLVLRNSATESPNYYYTDDFISFSKISNVNPEETCRWEKTRLISWRTPEGKLLQGVLHLPGSFDSTKKYPIIFHYYERMSDELNRFQVPGYTYGLLNIPWFVSRDYLVFTPDIDYEIGYPGRSALRAVESAADYLSKFPWIDTTKMGLQGHSFSGFETNYIITHSNRFAAAVAGSSLSDFISDYNSIMGGGQSRQFFFEDSQNRIGATLWERPDLYIENSPVLFADKVTTPLLLMSNKDDGIVPFTQGMEMFLSLRRLQKKVWLLQYDGEGHHVLIPKNTIDYTRRMTQFFDHYLKGAPEPRWMRDGIPAKMKGIDGGF